MAAAHAAGFKAPGLFIYFNVPSYPYQDKIISLLAFGWAVFIFSAAQNPTRHSVRPVLLGGGAALLMLACINFSTDFSSLSKNIDPRWFGIETAALFAYWVWLVVCYFNIRQ